MNAGLVLIVASIISSGVTVVVVSAKAPRGVVRWTFIAGVVLLALESVFAAFSIGNTELMTRWQVWRLLVTSFVPGTWLVFSLSYARGNYREFLSRWRFVVFAAFLPPILVAFGLRSGLFASSAQLESNGHWMLKLSTIGLVLNLIFLVFTLLILANLERTYRAAVGTMRWRIKFIILGVGLIFGVRAYTACQVSLYHASDISMQLAEAGALLIGCMLVGRSLFRHGLFDVDVYPDHEIFRNSLTIVLGGIYLLIVGVFAKIVAFLGGDASFALKTFVVLLILVLFALVLLSDRVRLRTRRFVSRHFQRPFYDYRTVWRRFTQGTAQRVEESDLCNETVKFVSDIFQALSVAIWLADESRNKFRLAASTSASGLQARKLEFEQDSLDTFQVGSYFSAHPEPVDVDTIDNSSIALLRTLQPDEFHKGGNRVCVPLISGGEFLGVMMLGDRVSGLRLSIQDFDLLKAIADQVTSNLLNIKLSERLSQAKQLEAFQAMSAFFVHDLKNTASTLSLMLHNLPTHFNDPRFREDALRGISKTVTHINDLIQRLSLLRKELTIQAVEGDLNVAVMEGIKSTETGSSIPVVKELGPLPVILLDSAQMQSVVVNLMVNAREALGDGGSIRIETARDNGWVVLSVADNGCGMDPEFIRRSLFRPFQTTKKQGIGIGMFQCKMIVEAHRGKIEVQSELAKGTTFRIFLPVPSATQ